MQNYKNPNGIQGQKLNTSNKSQQCNTFNQDQQQDVFKQIERKKIEEEQKIKERQRRKKKYNDFFSCFFKEEEEFDQYPYHSHGTTCTCYYLVQWFIKIINKYVKEDNLGQLNKLEIKNTIIHEIQSLEDVFICNQPQHFHFNRDNITQQFNEWNTEQQGNIADIKQQIFITFLPYLLLNDNKQTNIFWRINLQDIMMVTTRQIQEFKRKKCQITPEYFCRCQQCSMKRDPDHLWIGPILLIEKLKPIQQENAQVIQKNNNEKQIQVINQMMEPIKSQQINQIIDDQSIDHQSNDDQSIDPQTEQNIDQHQQEEQKIDQNLIENCTCHKIFHQVHQFIDQDLNGFKNNTEIVGLINQKFKQWICQSKHHAHISKQMFDQYLMKFKSHLFSGLQKQQFFASFVPICFLQFTRRKKFTTDDIISRNIIEFFIGRNIFPTYKFCLCVNCCLERNNELPSMPGKTLIRKIARRIVKKNEKNEKKKQKQEIQKMQEMQ